MYYILLIIINSNNIRNQLIILIDIDQLVDQ